MKAEPRQCSVHLGLLSAVLPGEDLRGARGRWLSQQIFGQVAAPLRAQAEHAQAAPPAHRRGAADLGQLRGQTEQIRDEQLELLEIPSEPDDLGLHRLGIARLVREVEGDADARQRLAGNTAAHPNLTRTSPMARMHFLAGALLALTGTAWAQATAPSGNITMFGVVDLTLTHGKGSLTKSDALGNSGLSGSRLGIRGSEDLGGGLAAGFTLEGQPSLDTGAMGQGGKMFGRQSNVWMEGGFGRVTAGRIHLPGRAFSIKYTATGWLSSDPLGNMALAVGSMFGPLMNGDAVGGRVSNALMYSSPRMGGVSFQLLQSAGEGGPFSTGQAKLTQGWVGFTAGDFTADEKTTTSELATFSAA